MNPMDRRGFLKASATLAGGWAAGRTLFAPPVRAAAGPPDIAVATGESAEANVARALEALGGMGRFVRRGAKVVVLPNPQGNRPGISTSAGVISEVVRSCLDAGAAEVAVASVHSDGRWYSSGILDVIKSSGAVLHYPRDRRDWLDATVRDARALKKALIVRKAVETDVLIDVPVFKQHDAAKVTGCLKNLMGFNEDNNSFHRDDAYLHRAIAELASLFKPALCVVDAMTVLAENGPFGPGRLLKPRQVAAGTDPVALDAWGCGLLGVRPADVPHIVWAAERGLGVADPARLVVRALAG
jgi:uncharacterized protein (DUF362 family)